MDTKACNLTISEIEELIMHHGSNISDHTEDRLERLNYLHKRLKTFFNEVETKPVPAQPAAWPNN